MIKDIHYSGALDDVEALRVSSGRHTALFVRYSPFAARFFDLVTAYLDNIEAALHAETTSNIAFQQLAQEFLDSTHHELKAIVTRTRSLMDQQGCTTAEAYNRKRYNLK